MRYYALATDYDGTLASEGRVDETVVEALKRLRTSGRRLVLVTGRELPDLQHVFPHMDLFDQVVVENGGVLYCPATKDERSLGPPPPRRFIDELRRRGVERLSVGRVVVATWRPDEIKVFEVIRDLELELQVVFNKGAVMVLPSGVNKATGLWAALDAMELSPHNVVGVGDAENDQAFLRLCECSVAVANALPSVKEYSDMVTRGARGQGVGELAQWLIESDLREAEPRLSRHDILLGTGYDGTEVRLKPYGNNMLLCGQSGAGKSTLAAGVFERVAQAGYQFCLIDPEGEYRHSINAVVLGSAQRTPTIEEIVELLNQPRQNAVVNLLGTTMDQRPAYFDRLLPALLESRARTGRPHWIAIDEAQYVLPNSWAPLLHTAPQHLQGMILISAYPDRIAPQVLAAMDLVVIAGKSVENSVRQFTGALGEPQPVIPAPGLESGEDQEQSLVWRRHPPTEPFWLRVPLPRGEHRRHQRKYVEGELRPEIHFYFRGPRGQLQLRAQNLAMFLHLAEGVDDETWSYHLHRHDYSRWFRDAIRNGTLAEEAERVENDRSLSATRSRSIIKKCIQKRYVGVT
jgi:HAD superfamily hydrolase (TIGR01484 family)